MPGVRTRPPCGCCDICTAPFSEVYSQFQKMFTLLCSDPLELRTGHCFTLSIQLLMMQISPIISDALPICQLPDLYSLPNLLFPPSSRHTSSAHLSSSACIQKTATRHSCLKDASYLVLIR